jgi:hypothetical protein
MAIKSIEESCINQTDIFHSVRGPTPCEIMWNQLYTNRTIMDFFFTALQW